MTASLIEELDSTLGELDRLTEQWEQMQTYERAVARMRYLAPTFAALVEDMKRTRLLVPDDMWSQIRTTFIHECPAEIATIGRTLMGSDEQFMRVISYVGFVRGVLMALREMAATYEQMPNPE